MADWVNNGSYKDISDLAKDSIVPTSQQAGNQVWANNAMTAPGGASGDLGEDVGKPVVAHAPVLDEQAEIEPGDDGKPQPGNDHLPSSPSWGKTTVANVVRRAM